MHRLFASIAVAICLCVGTLAAESTESTLVAATSVSGSPLPLGLTIRKHVNEVRVTFHAIDKQKHPVLNMSPDSVAVIDNGMPVETLSDFESASDLPLNLALMVDVSDSVVREFAKARETSGTLIRTLVHAGDDRVTLVAFRDKICLNQPMTSEPQDLLAMLRQIRTGGLTALYDAVLSTSDRLAQSEASASRRAIILISDGDDTVSHYGLSDAIAAAIRDDVAIYAIRLHGRHDSLFGEKELQAMAEATGGRVYNLRGREDLSRALEEVERDLRTQYFVTYRPSPGSGFHTVKLTSTIKDVSIRARKGYFASAER